MLYEQPQSIVKLIIKFPVDEAVEVVCGRLDDSMQFIEGGKGKGGKILNGHFIWRREFDDFGTEIR